METDDIKPYLQLIQSIAKKVIKPNISLEDLIQEGYIGYLQAKKYYQEDLEMSFFEFATIVIERVMLSFIEKEEEYIIVKKNAEEDFSKKENIYDPIENIHLHYDLFRSLNQAHLNIKGYKVLLMTHGFTGTYTLMDKASELKMNPGSVKWLERKSMEKLRVTTAKTLLDYADDKESAEEQIKKAKLQKSKSMYRGKL